MKAFENELRSPLLGRLLPWLLIFPVAAALSPLPASAAISQSINYQGFLLSKVTSLPVETPQDINFVIYNAAVGGTALFTESRCNVGVSKGRYDVEIGTSTGGIPGALFTDNQNLWLEIQVDPDGSCSGTYEAMTPRIRLQASPFAFNALYASTASAATPVFTADVIGALSNTANGAITISTNLFVQGGISVGSISPGQKLAVSGLVESRGEPGCDANPLNYTCGFRFPDGTTQVTAAANTMWAATGDYLYNMNPGNLGIGEFSNPPLARLHVSSAAGDAGELLRLSTGTSAMFRVTGLGQVYGGSYYGNGATLTGIVARAGDTMTGPLTLAGSSLTVTSGLGVGTPKIKFLDKVEISSATAANYGGVYISTHVRLSPGSIFYGDGSGLSGVVTTDLSKVLKAGDTMTGQLTLADSTLTVTGNAFSVGGSTLTVLSGNTALGAASYLARLTVTGGIVATSSITAQQGLYTTTLNGSSAASFQTVTASSATFWGWGPSNYSIETASSIKVNAGFFIGDGSQLTNVAGTDATKLIKAGDTMTGHLLVSPSSVTILSMGEHEYALTIASAAAVNTYIMSVTTAGRVGVGVAMPLAPLEVNSSLMVSNWQGADVFTHLYSNAGKAYTRWSDNGLSGFGNVSLGAMGYLTQGFTRPFIFQALGTSPGIGGSEVFRINLDAADISSGNSWRFGIGTSNPLEKFHVAASMLVSTDTLSPILYISTTSGLVGVGSSAPSHKLAVTGGILAVSSITAQGGFFGDGSGLTNISAGGLPGQIEVSSIAARLDSTYGAVVFTSDTYVNAKLAVGQVFTPTSDLHVRGTARLDQKNSGDPVALSLYPSVGGQAYISWDDGSWPGKKGALGMLGTESDLAYWAGSPTLGGIEAFRIKSDGRFLMGGAGAAFVPRARFHIVSDLMVSTSAATPILFISTSTGYVGISTDAAKEGLHVASSLLVGPDRANAELYVSTGSSAVGIGTGNPLARLEVYNGAVLADGTTGDIPMTGAGTRFMWIPSASAIRAGHVTLTQWDVIGNDSVAFGQDGSAPGTAASVLGGLSNAASGNYSTVPGGATNLVYGPYSAIPGGRDNVVYSSYSFAGGRNNYLDTNSEGTFVWGYDDGTGGYGTGSFNTFRIAGSYLFLIDPSDVKHYKAGIRTPSPQTVLDVNGDAQFGAGVTKSTFTAEGYWQPRAMTTAEMQAVTPSVIGAVVYNSTIANICFSTGTVNPGDWAIAGSKADCY